MFVFQELPRDVVEIILYNLPLGISPSVIHALNVEFEMYNHVIEKKIKITNDDDLLFRSHGYPFIKDMAREELLAISSLETIREAIESYDTNPDYNKVYGPIQLWDVSKVTHMNELFMDMKEFNEDISNWDVSNVIDMSAMFYWATSFNQDISNWDVSKVTDMNKMFKFAQDFNQDIGSWDVSKLICQQCLWRLLILIKISVIGMYQV